MNIFTYTSAPLLPTNPDIHQMTTKERPVITFDGAISGKELVSLTSSEESEQPLPKDPAWQLENNPALTPEEKSILANHIAEKEHQAFAHFAKQSPPNLPQYYAHYMRYLESLPENERQSERYVGQHRIATKLYEKALAEDNTTEQTRYSKQISLFNYIGSFETFDVALENNTKPGLLKPKVVTDEKIEP